MYISFHDACAMHDDSGSLASFRRVHLTAVVAEVTVVVTVVMGAIQASHFATVGFVPPSAWRLSPQQGWVAYLSLWGLTFVAMCLLPVWRYAMLRPNPRLTQQRVLRRLLTTSLITFLICGAPALLACVLFVLNSRPGGAWFLYFPFLSLFLLFAYIPVRSNWEERLRAAQPAPEQRAANSALERTRRDRRAARR